MTASKLIKPNVDYKDSYLQALREYQKEGDYTHLNLRTLPNEFEAFLEDRLNERAHLYESFPDWVEPVPETELWMVKDDEYIGSVHVRHRLNWHLEKWGGHLYFTIRPTKRNMGYGKKILRKIIPFCYAIGIDRALLTIAPENAVARHIVEKCGAVFEDQTPGTDRFPPRCRYWLDCAQ